MKELKDYYEKSKRKWFSITVSAWVILVIIFNIIAKLLSNSVTTTCITDQDVINNIEFLIVFLSALVPTTAALVFYFSILDYVNKEGWRKKFPQYDINGEWSGTISFTKSISSTGWDTNNKNESIPVHIEQTCNTLRIKPSGSDNMRFYSILADWDERDRLNILYKAEYYKNLRKQDFPECRLGYEELHIDTQGLTLKEKPLKITGTFRHCLTDDGKPIYMGDVVYERKQK